jgi:2-polyprenyl-3-methyl-5-hydroxy-6-metoxy-1,4-benzoquinol methylase
MSEQQSQTREFFDAVAEDWRFRAEGGVADRVNVVAQRNGAALRIARTLPDARRFLDIGCGTGELTFAMAAAGLDAVGLDFAARMIELCEAKKRATAFDSARFVHGSIFDFTCADGSFDIVAAMGFIEYISPAELERLATKAARMLRPGGALALGSRNRLFNLFSLNDYTALELGFGIAADLLAEAVAIASAPTMDTAVAAARGKAGEYPHAAKHPITQIGVETRHQYTPGELIRLFEGSGFAARSLLPIHVHAMSVPAKAAFEDLHVRLAALLNERASEDHRLVPQSSSYVLHLERR